MNRWSNRGVLDRVFAHLQHTQITRVKIERIEPGALDSTIVKDHPEGADDRVFGT